MLQQGFVIRDQRAVKRLANIPAGPTTSPSNVLIDNVIRAVNKHSVNMGKMWFLYCDADVFTQLALAANDVAFRVRDTDQNIFKTNLTMIGPNVVVRRLDALNHALDDGETVLT